MSSKRTPTDCCSTGQCSKFVFVASLTDHKASTHSSGIDDIGPVVSLEPSRIGYTISHRLQRMTLMGSMRNGFGTSIHGYARDSLMPTFSTSSKITNGGLCQGANPPQYLRHRLPREGTSPGC